MTPLEEGLHISIVGLGLVFVALGLLIILLYVLRWISNALLESHERAQPAAAVVAADIEPGDDDEFARVAVIAVALVRAQMPGGRDASLGELLHQPATGWRPVRN